MFILFYSFILHYLCFLEVHICNCFHRNKNKFLFRQLCNKIIFKKKWKMQYVNVKCSVNLNSIMSHMYLFLHYIHQNSFCQCSVGVRMHFHLIHTLRVMIGWRTITSCRVVRIICLSLITTVEERKKAKPDVSRRANRWVCI